MLNSKLISISEELPSRSTLSSYFAQCINDNSHQSKDVGIIIAGEANYSKYISQCSHLEHHFRPFYSLLGYIDDPVIDHYQDVRNGLGSMETCILIGSEKNYINALSKQTESKKSSHRVANIQKTAMTSTEYEVYNLGYTRHNTPIDVLDTLDSSQAFSLGTIKQDINSVEPLVRDIRLACIDVSMISNVSVGLTIFEMCSIARYLGYANSLHTLYLYHSDLDNSEDAMEQIALLTWYFLEGRQHRQDDYPSNPSNQKYLVYSDLLDTDIEFSKSKLTGRWWMQNPGNAQNYIPISFSEYEATVNTGLPSRILQQLN